RSGDWKVTTEFLDFAATVDPGRVDQMTEGVKPVPPSQPTLLTRGVDSVMPSRFFAAIKVFGLSKDEKKKLDQDSSANEDANPPGDFDQPPPEAGSGKTISVATSTNVSLAPVVHLATPRT